MCHLLPPSSVLIEERFSKAELTALEEMLARIYRRACLAI
jgi:hypothetical protein